jgi:hypothetical protein
MNLELLTNATVVVEDAMRFLYQRKTNNKDKLKSHYQLQFLSVITPKIRMDPRNPIIMKIHK